MSSAALDIFKAWGEFSPDIEEFDLSCCCISASGGDVHHPKNAAWSLFYVINCYTGFKVVLLMGFGSFRSCVWVGRVFLSGTGLLRGTRLTAVAFLTGTGLLSGTRLTVWRLGMDRITVWQEDRHC